MVSRPKGMKFNLEMDGKRKDNLGYKKNYNKTNEKP